MKQLKKELKGTMAKFINEYRVENRIQKITYESFYYRLKALAEDLGIENDNLKNL